MKTSCMIFTLLSCIFRSELIRVSDNLWIYIYLIYTGGRDRVFYYAGTAFTKLQLIYVKLVRTELRCVKYSTSIIKHSTFTLADKIILA